MSVDNSNVLVPDERIMIKIYLIRDQKVMLDCDLADLFSVKAIRLRKPVKRNSDKFPEHFMFQLTENEIEVLVSQNVIPSSHLPLVF